MISHKPFKTKEDLQVNFLNKSVVLRKAYWLILKNPKLKLNVTVLFFQD